MDVIFLWISVAAAIITNSAFYWIAFKNSGFNGFFSTFLMIAFISSEMAYWYSSVPDTGKTKPRGFVGNLFRITKPKKEKDSILWLTAILKILLLAYSIHTTQAGQFFQSSVTESKEIGSELSRESTEKTLEELQHDLETYSNENLLIELAPLNEQLKSYNEQLNLYIQLQNKFGTEQNRKDREATEARISSTNSSIEKIRNDYKENRDRINEQIKAYRDDRTETSSNTKARTAYDFYSDRYDIEVEQVKMWSQLLAACILAFIGPTSLTILRKMKNKKDPEKREPEKQESVNNQKKDKPEFSAPDDIPNLSPVKENKVKDPAIKKNIIRILYRDIEKEGGTILNPKACLQEFRKMQKERYPALYIPSVEEIESVLQEIEEKGLMSMRSPGEVIRRIVA